MRLSPRKAEATRRTREEQRRQARAAAPTLRNALPAVSRIAITLCFDASGPSAPASQWHAMHPAARAYFEVPCPYGDCDGTYDLTSLVNLVATQAKKRSTGTLECAGMRSREGSPKQTCGLVANYTIDAEYHAPTHKRA